MGILSFFGRGAAGFTGLVTGADGGDATPVSSSNPLPVAPPLTQSGEWTVSFTPSASYAANAAVGPSGAGNARMTIATGLPAGTRILINRFVLSVPHAGATQSNLNVMLFASAPPSTFTDAAVPTFTAADVAPLRSLTSGGAVIQSSTLLAYSLAPNSDITVGPGGNIYLVVTCLSALTFTSAGAGTLVINYRF